MRPRDAGGGEAKGAQDHERPTVRSAAREAISAVEVGDDAVERHGAEILAGARAQADRALLGLALADDEHVGHLAHLGVADAVAELLVAVVELGADARRAQPLVHRARVVDVLLADRQHARLHRAPARSGTRRRSARSGCR